MKTTIFFWMLLLPFTLQASDALDHLFSQRDRLYRQLNSQQVTESYEIEPVGSTTNDHLLRRIMETDNAIIHKLTLERSIEGSKVSSEAEKYKSIVFSQEKDIQTLRSTLAQKNLEINTSSFEARKFKHGTWIFFLGTLLFCGLYLKDKISFKGDKIFSLYPSETH